MPSAFAALNLSRVLLGASLLIRVSSHSCAPEWDSPALDAEKSDVSDEASHDIDSNLNLLQLRSQRISRPASSDKIPDPTAKAACCGGVGAYQHSQGHSAPESLSMLQFRPTFSFFSTASSKRTQKTIFLNSKYSGHLEDGSLECPAAQCTVTHDTAAATTADAVVWNARWMNPLEVPPHPKPAGQRWIFNFFFEAPIYKGERVNDVETGLVQDAGGVDWTMTYSPRSDIFSPIGRLVPVNANDHSALTPSLASASYAAGKSHLLLWFVSNCDGLRLQFFQRLQGLLPRDLVHIYGDCGEPSPCPGRNETDECHQKLFSKYKFYAAFENSRCDGYITEKFFRPLADGMVPLVMGGLHRSDYEALAPKDSFIDVDDFRSLSDLAAHLMYLDADDKAYDLLHSWRSAFFISNTLETTQHAFCELCQRLHNDPSLELLQANSSKAKEESGTHMLENWWYDGACRSDVPLDW